jgi:hypothetical protein
MSDRTENHFEEIMDLFYCYFKFMGDDFVHNMPLWIAQAYYMKDSSNYFIAAWTELNKIVKYMPKYALQLKEDFHEQGAIRYCFYIC